EEREADTLQNPALELALREARIDDPAAVVSRDHAKDANVAGVGVHFDLDELRAEGKERGVVRVRSPAPLTHDHDVAELLTDLRKRELCALPLGPWTPLPDAHDAVAGFQVFGRRLEDLSGGLEQPRARVLGGHPHGWANGRRRLRPPRIAGIGKALGVAEDGADVTDVGS